MGLWTLVNNRVRTYNPPAMAWGHGSAVAYYVPSPEFHFRAITQPAPYTPSWRVATIPKDRRQHPEALF